LDRNSASTVQDGTKGFQVKPNANQFQVTAHAKGGVFGPDGVVPLKKYAKGGIASSPQLALFGEGSHKEAYVPLPDGRSIPVTFTGGGEGSGGDSVAISITVQNYVMAAASHLRNRTTALCGTIWPAK
jgi:hypothetical protein